MSTNEVPAEKVKEEEKQFQQRDAETQLVLGLFVFILSIPVMLGAHWANNTHAMIVNLVAGGVLLLVGLTMLVRGIRGKK